MPPAKTYLDLAFFSGKSEAACSMYSHVSTLLESATEAQAEAISERSATYPRRPLNTRHCVGRRSSVPTKLPAAASIYDAEKMTRAASRRVAWRFHDESLRQRDRVAGGRGQGAAEFGEILPRGGVR